MPCDQFPRELSEALVRNRDRLLRMVAIRMDPVLQRRIDASDVVQEAYLEAARRFGEYKEQRMSLFVWLRLLVAQKLVQLHRQHCVVQGRDIRREITAYACPQASSGWLAEWLVDSRSSPSVRVARAELVASVREALEQLPPLDREVLALRHFEQLTHTEIAESLGTTVDAARKRYLRALKRLASAVQPLLGPFKKGNEP
ncbi:MAG: hypothetical protein KatS3mg110_1121 [Pirellulaceae bacterium]|nr:MAG: hypothetical protein KatS3mg110_1121 [Pirellulaceae bacterium]